MKGLNNSAAKEERKRWWYPLISYQFWYMAIFWIDMQLEE